MPAFASGRPRDAWGPIRGFVYQVDLTIERWLSLGNGEAIELERGEDIDLVARALAGDEEARRQLEQVKHRDKSLTLRSSEAASALANAVEHIDNNPGLALVFRFTTNAAIGREKPSPMPGKRRALEVWEEIRTGTAKPEDILPNLTSLRSLLSSLAKPADFNEATWKSFQRFLVEADEATFLKLVQAFQWATRATPAKDMSRRIEATLLRLGHAADGRSAELLYQRLFLRVFKLLSSPGVKRLTPEDLASDIAAGPLAPEDRQLLDTVRERLGALERRVDEVQRQFTEHSAAISARINELAAAQGIRAAVDYTVQSVSFSAPTAVARLTRRSATVSGIATRLEEHTWLALFGSPGTGSTELAKLIHSSKSPSYPWIDFAGLSQEQAALRLDCAVGLLAPAAPSPAHDRRSAYSVACAQVVHAHGRGGVIVFNDIPDLSGRDPLSARLPEFAASCRQHGIRLLSTSTKPLPTSIEGLLSANDLATFPTPPFTDEEVEELFAAHGAPAGAISPRLLHVINVLAGGHPTLLAAAARYLSRLGWQLTEQDADALLRGQYATELRPETAARLAEEVADDDSRQLLYRLNLAVGAFQLDDVVALASVEPAIAHPLEHLDQLTDVCLTRMPQQRLRVSPLFRTLGSLNVPQATSAACHVRLAESIVARDRISPYDAAGAFSHFIAGGAIDRAGVLLLRSLAMLDELDPPFDDALLGSVYDQTPLPTQMDLGVRMLIRAHQVRICSKLNRDSSHALADLDTLLPTASAKDAWAVLGAGIVMSSHLATSDVPRANQYLSAAIASLPKVREAMADHWQPPDFDPELMLWPNALNISSESDLADWMATVDKLTPEQRNRLFSHELAQGGSLYMAERLWLRELEKEPSARNWSLVDDALRRFGEWAGSHQAVLLDAAATRVRIVIHSEQLRDLEGAVALADLSIARFPNSGVAKYLVQDAIGTQFVLRGRPKDGIARLTAALGDVGSSFQAQGVQTHLYLARAEADLQNFVGAVAHSRTAVDQVRALGEDVGEILFARALGELGVSLWLRDGVRAAFTPLNEAFDHLRAARDQGLDAGEDWRGAMVAFSHVCGYLAAIANGSASPNDEDGQPRPPPRVGLMTSAGTTLASIYRPEKFPAFFGMLAVYADKIGAEGEAARRAVQGLEAARAGNSIITVSSLGTTYLPQLILTGAPNEVIDTALEAAIALAALQQLRASQADVFSTDRTVDQILGPRPSARWSQAEGQAQLLGLLPLAIQLATVRVDSPERAAEAASEAANACRLIATNASKPEIWNEAARVLEAGFVVGGSGRELMESARAAQSSGDAALGAMGFLAASLQDDVPVEAAARIHAHLLADIAQRLGTNGPTGASYLRIAVPFISAYWSRVFKDQRFRFTPPAIVARQLAEAEAQPLTRRAQAVLAAALAGLGVSPPPDVQAWFDAQ